MTAAKKINPEVENIQTEKPAEALRAASSKRLSRMSSSGEHEDGEGNWLVSYADMMTLLFGFFVLLQSFSTINAKKFENVKKESSAAFSGEYESPYGELTKKIRAVVQKENLTNQVTVDESSAGITINFNGQIFFDSGLVDIKSEAYEMLKKIVMNIRSEAKDYYITIEGHTDQTPISSGLIASNWELSALRATRVLRFFIDQGYDAKRLKSIGWGETKPIDLKDSSKNRRVMIFISKGENE